MRTVRIAVENMPIYVMAKDGQELVISEHLFHQYEKWLWLHNYVQMQIDQLVNLNADDGAGEA